MRTIVLNDGREAQIKSPEEMLKFLINLKKELGHWPSIEEVSKRPEMPTPLSYAFFFKTYDNAVKKAKNLEKPKKPAMVKITLPLNK